MNRSSQAVFMLSVVALLLVACIPIPSSPPATAESPVVAPTAPAGEWQTYTDAEAGYSLQIPPNWSSEDLPAQETLHGTAFTGPEGGVEVTGN